MRVYELGGMSSAARDLRISPAVASARVSQLETHLGVRLFQRTTRKLTPTEQGDIFYDGALQVLAAVVEAESGVSEVTDNPRGLLHVAAPLGLGRRLIAPNVPAFVAKYPSLNVRLRLSDHPVDLTAEGLNAAFILGRPAVSDLMLRPIASCRRVLCASPDYLERHGRPTSGRDLESGTHNCLNLRFPGATEFRWDLQTQTGSKKFAVTGRFESDDGDVLTDWARAGEGIALKPVFEVAEDLRRGCLVTVLDKTPPLPVQIACVYTHRRHQDPKTRLFMEFFAARIKEAVMDTHTGPDRP